MFKPYPYEITPFTKDRLNDWYKEAIPQMVQCPICKNGKSKGFCGYCGCPLELTTVIWVKVNLRSRGTPGIYSGLDHVEEKRRSESYNKAFESWRKTEHMKLLSSSEPVFD